MPVKNANDLGYKNESQIIGKTDKDLFGEEFGMRTWEDEKKVLQDCQPIVGQIECFVNQFGQANWTSTNKFPLRDGQGQIVGLIGFTNEINELRRAERDLEIKATHDPLTSLPNRTLLMNRINNLIETADIMQKQFAILFIDINNFKSINDQYGHQTGDQILIDVGRILQSCVRDTDTVARYGGDEFIIILDRVSQPFILRKIVRKIVAKEKKYFAEKNYPVGLSIGASLFPTHGNDFTSLISAADQAMYTAKKVKRPSTMAE
jgi:diguanylate cyclase (GGDEF)-like protein